MLKSRDDFPTLINARNYTTAVEIGVKRGQFSAYLLQRCPQLQLHSVDPWETLGPGESERRQHWKDAVALLSRYKGRSTILKMKSTEAASLLGDKRFDFVFIDGNHSRAGVERDIECWWPLVRSGGVLAGHDYVNHPRYKYGIISAVEEFAAANNLQIQLTSLAENPTPEQRRSVQNNSKPFSAIPSWYFDKP